ncbi:MAG: HPr family phosphocarrier protein [Acidobacteria bacterium]|nr:HPr family phosphocarrier protein [Acidobacteriota bacterium]
MVEREAVIVAEEGLHARPAAEFVKVARGYSSEIKMIKGETQANAKSTLTLMTLGATKDERVVIRAEGEDEAAAVEALADLISKG